MDNPQNQPYFFTRRVPHKNGVLFSAYVPDWLSGFLGCSTDGFDGLSVPEKLDWLQQIFDSIEQEA